MICDLDEMFDPRVLPSLIAGPQQRSIAYAAVSLGSLCLGFRAAVGARCLVAALLLMYASACASV